MGNNLMLKGESVNCFEEGTKGLIRIQRTHEFAILDYSNKYEDLCAILKERQWVEFEVCKGMLIDTGLNIKLANSPSVYTSKGSYR